MDKNVPPQAHSAAQGKRKKAPKRASAFDGVKHYQRIVAALQDTISLMEEIDETIEMRGGWPIE